MVRRLNRKRGEIQILTIAWDIDDVLNNLMESWHEHYILSSKIHSNVLYDDLLENPPNQILGVSMAEYLKSLDDFRFSEKGRNLEPNQEILKWMEEKGRFYRHIALTSTPQKTAHLSAYWVMKNFGKWIRSFNFVPSSRDDDDFPLYDKNKKEFLSQMQTIDIFIDDNQDNVEDVKTIGINGLLIKRPWNNDGYSIKEVFDILDNIAGNKSYY